MNWPHYRETVTVVDVLDAGACWEGVRDWLEKHGRIAGPTPKNLHVETVPTAAYADGSGSGSGSGNGDGDESA